MSMNVYVIQLVMYLREVCVIGSVGFTHILATSTGKIVKPCHVGNASNRVSVGT